jgi:hypothetical protein
MTPAEIAIWRRRLSRNYGSNYVSYDEARELIDEIEHLQAMLGDDGKEVTDGKVGRGRKRVGTGSASPAGSGLAAGAGDSGRDWRRSGGQGSKRIG